jgi:ATP-dependent RNA helicase DDX52/ROK1
LLNLQALHRELMYEGIHVDSISGDQPNSARTAAVDNFRAGKTWVLIATDLIGRGEGGNIEVKRWG